MTTKITIFSDTHVTCENCRFNYERDISGYENVKNVLQRLARDEKDSDYMLCLGDLISDNIAECVVDNYKLYDKLIAEYLKEVDIYAVPGNHDKLELLTELENVIYKRTPVWAFKANDEWLQVLICSKSSHHTAGMLSERLLNMLQEILNENKDMNVMMVMHHPVVDTGCNWLDNIYEFPGKEAFCELIKANPQIKLIINGHAHQYTSNKLGNAEIVSIPASSYQFLANSYDYALDTDIAAGYMTLKLIGNEYSYEIKRVSLTLTVQPNNFL